MFQKISILPLQRVFWFEPPTPLEFPFRVIPSYKKFWALRPPPQRAIGNSEWVGGLKAQNF